jgi:hypothetical protein
LWGAQGFRGIARRQGAPFRFVQADGVELKSFDYAARRAKLDKLRNEQSEAKTQKENLHPHEPKVGTR